MARQTATNAGRRDAEIWMQETPESEWVDAIKPGVLGADEALINGLGATEAAKHLGISNPYRNGRLTDAASKAFEEYSRAWAKRVSAALGSEKTPTRHHATKKSPAQLQREIDEVIARPGAARRAHSTKPQSTYRTFTIVTYPEGHRGLSKMQWYRSASPVAWTVARDRLIAAGVLDPDLAGRTSSPGGWMLSIDPNDYSEARAKPLP